MLKKESQHYIFHYKKGSKAEKDIESIINGQESCHDHICRVLKVQMHIKINYYLCESAEDLGVIYGDNEACNGFAEMPNNIYAVYSDTVKCLGYHEDAHLISYNCIAKPKYNFIKEGLAMFFDKNWLGISNISWTKYLYEHVHVPSFSGLMDYDDFHRTGEKITYPISGAFVDYLITIAGMESFKDLYGLLDKEEKNSFMIVYKKSLNQLESEFKDYIKQINIDKAINEMMRSRF